MRTAPLLLSFMLAAACGGKPVGRKVPRVDPAKAAGVAAAAAALTTLANPDHAKRIQERKGGDGRPGKTKDTGEQVPEEVLARAEDYAKAEEYMNAKEDADVQGRPCSKGPQEPKEDDTTDSPRLELIPKDDEIGIAPAPCIPSEESVEVDAGVAPTR